MNFSGLVLATVASLLLTGAAAGGEPGMPSFLQRDLRLDTRIDFHAGRLAGSATIEMENWTDHPARDVSVLINRLMDATGVRDGAGTSLPYTQDVVRFRDLPMRQVTQVLVRLPKPVAPGARTTLRLDYAGSISGFTEGGWLYVRDRIDTSFTILRWEGLAYPVLAGLSDSANRRTPNVDFTYDVSVDVPSGFVVAAGGQVTHTPNADGTVMWRFVSGLPSPFLNVCIARYETQVAGGVRVSYFPADSAGARWLMTKTQAALRSYERWFGPLRQRPELAITEIPDGWGSQADAVGGIIQTAAAFRDAGRLGELYHELSHLWNTPDTDLPSPRWNEGLASFLEDLMREQLDGWRGRAASDSAMIDRLKQRLAADSTLRVVPFSEYGRHGMTGWSYRVGDVMFATLYELVGAEDFNHIVGGYYQAFPEGGTTRDFVAFAKRTAARDPSELFEDWLFTTRWTKRVEAASSVHELAAGYRKD